MSEDEKTTTISPKLKIFGGRNPIVPIHLESQKRADEILRQHGMAFTANRRHILRVVK